MKSLLETLLFSSPQPLTVEEMVYFTEGNQEDVLCQLEALQREYQERDGGIIIRVLKNKWQMVVRPEYGAVLKRKARNTNSKVVSRAALETLAIISLYQPLTKAEIDLRRGVDSAQAIKTLLENSLITICGKSEVPGRPFLYRVTEKFFEIFGLEGENELQRILQILKDNGTAK
ncbi:MAG: SMC-Scp complex subunit ScpB [Candidatus Caldatribacteriaceae bacterium]